MKNETRIRGKIVSSNGTHFVKEDEIDMEIHDAIDYIVLKYITKGGKIAAMPMKFVNEMSREEDRIRRDKAV